MNYENMGEWVTIHFPSLPPPLPKKRIHVFGAKPKYLAVDSTHTAVGRL